MTTNLFVVADVKQLQTGGSFRILLPFYQTSWSVGILNSAIFNSFHNQVWHDFGGSSEFRGEGGGVNTPNPPLSMPSFTQYSSCQCSHITSQVQGSVTCSLCIKEASVPKTNVLTQRTRYTWQVMNFYVNTWWRILASSGMALTIACALVSGSLHSLKRTSWTAHCTSWHKWAN